MSKKFRIVHPEALSAGIPGAAAGENGNGHLGYSLVITDSNTSKNEGEAWERKEAPFSSLSW
jgi:hypothetical protein